MIDDYIIFKSQDGCEWGLTTIAGWDDNPCHWKDSDDEDMIVIARLYGIGWETANAVKEALIEGE